MIDIIVKGIAPVNEKKMTCLLKPGPLQVFGVWAMKQRKVI
jgi:hypothetical protein